ncbi:MAG: TlpA disulfide reductase family protein [Acidobacteriota bacterium]
MANDDQVLNKQLSALNEPEGFQPNAERARILLQTRTAPRSRRLMWTAVTAAAALFLLVALPAGRAVALNGDRPFVSIHESIHALFAPIGEWHNHIIRVINGWPEPAPDFTLADASGKSVTLSDYKGKVVLLNFWATWCAPCKAETPWFMDLQKTYGDDLVVLGVAMDEDGWGAVRPFIEQRQVNYPIMLGTPQPGAPQLPGMYRNIESLPSTFLIDRKGRIRGTHAELATKAMYEEWVKELL